MTNQQAAQKQYSLNQGQKEAAEAFFEFLFSNDKEFIISGYAGTGKTYLMSSIIDITLPRYFETCKLIGIDPVFNEVVMTATTNKAAEVLAAATQRPTSTIHSFLGLKVYEDYSSGKTKLTKSNNWRVNERKIIFIDECSMIDSELYKVLHEGTHNCKLVFVGDHNQLAPVMETLSPVYKQNAPFFNLSQPMRNANQQALMDVCQQLRETVATGVFKPITLVPGVIDLLNNEQMQNQINQEFQGQNLQSRILAYTNKRVLEYNDYIRTLRNLPNEYQAGEFLVNNSAAKIGSRMLSVEELIEVRKNHGFSSIKIDTNPDGSDVNLDVNKLDIYSTINGPMYNIVIPVNKTHYNDLIRYYKRTKNWERYYHLKNNYPDLRPRDAATVHKSQGSTYDSVFIDLSNISTCTMADQTARMLYVAFSRARERIFLYGDLAAKYGGINA